MIIEDMPAQACIDMLSTPRLGRLACALEAQPYITPLFFAYHSSALYSVSTVGQKIHWMRVNPLVCVQIDDVVTPQQWSSVIVSGRYEELPREAGGDDGRDLAYSLLQKRPIWWEPVYAKTIRRGGSERPMELVYFRIAITEITGHRAKDQIG